MDLSRFNDEQRAAITHPIGGAAAVIAGAGSGKTSVLTARVKYLIDDKRIAPNRVLCVTFTNKAANEVQERIGMAEEEVRPRICTIHSLALSAIRRAPKGFGLGAKVTPLDEYDQREMIKRIVDQLKLEEAVNPYLFLEKLQYHRARGVGFHEDYTAEVDTAASIAHGGYHRMTPEELDIWAAYTKQKSEISVVDFDDMIHLVVRRGRTDETWLTNVQKAFDFVLQDETQDTNKIQWDMLNMMLAPRNTNMFCVGDISQSIYGFNGAAPEILLNYTKEWRGTVPALYRLAQNHRSVPEVVSLANKTQLYMTDTVPLQMESYRGRVNGERGQILLRRGATPRDIAASVSEDILASRVPYKDTAILIRAGSQVRDIETELVRNRIPYIIRGTMGLLQTEEVKDILAYMKIATNPNDFAALCRSVSVPKRGIGDASLKRIQTLAAAHGGDLIETLSAGSIPKLAPYTSVIKEIQDMSSSPSAVVDHLIRRIGYIPYLKAKYKKFPERIEIKEANILRLKEMIESLMETRDLTIEDVIFQLTMQDQKDVSPEGKVVISTIHSAKGLEWHTVYLMGLFEGSLPHKWSTSDAEIAEERRIFYVGCTRARDQLVLCVPASVEYFNKGPQFVAPSRFLTELGICK